MHGFPLRTLLASFTFLVVIVTLWLSYYTVPEGYRGVITRNGAVVGVAEPGLGFKVPFIDMVTDMSIQTQLVTWAGYEAYSRDIQQSTSKVTVTYRIDPTAVAAIYSNFGVTYAEKVLWPLVNQKGKEVYGKFAAAEIVAQRDEFGVRLEQAIIDGVEAPWLIIERVQVENLSYSEAYEKAVEAAAQAEADVKRARQELEKIKVDAQQKVAQAQAEADARVLAADAEAYQIKARGEAEAAAIMARAEALRRNPNLVSLVTAEKWNGTLPTTMVPGDVLPFIEMPTTQPDQ